MTRGGRSPYVSGPLVSRRAAVLGVLASIYWLRTKGNLCPGLTFSTELIARDEALHAEFAIEMYNLLENPLPTELVHEVLSEAVALEEAFVKEAPETFRGHQRG